MEKTSTFDFIYFICAFGLLAFGVFFLSALMVFKNFFPRQYHQFFKKKYAERDRLESPSNPSLFDLSLYFADRPLTDGETDRLTALFKQKYSALELGPFTAEIGRQIARASSRLNSNQINYATTLSARVQPAHNCAFTIEFPRIIPPNTTTATAMKSWIITCENDELKQFLKSDKFAGIILTLNALAPGAIQCVGNLFRVELHRTLIAEKDLDAFWTISKEAFVKYAQQVQLYLPEWRGYDWWNEVVPDADNQKKRRADNQPTACGD